MTETRGPKKDLPWISKNTPEMDKVIVGLVQELFEISAVVIAYIKFWQKTATNFPVGIQNA